VFGERIKVLHKPPNENPSVVDMKGVRGVASEVFQPPIDNPLFNPYSINRAVNKETRDYENSKFSTRNNRLFGKSIGSAATENHDS
jgi:hypothetical protein